MTLVHRCCRAAVFAAVLFTASTAHAQAIGTFRWQQQPYCNVITLNVVQQGTVYQVDGYDDQCGAGTRAAAAGIAFLNPNGSIGFGLTIVTSPGGTPVHLDATIDLASLNGTWRDSGGATGPFTFVVGGTSGGPPRAARVHALDVSAYTGAVDGPVLPSNVGCMFFGTTGPGRMVMDVPLPGGAVPVEVRFRYRDTSAASSLQVEVQSSDFQPQPNVAIVGGATTVTGSPYATGVVSFAAPLSPVSATRSYQIQVFGPASYTGSLLFCGAQVLYTMP
jgi:hypothetical protein